LIQELLLIIVVIGIVYFMFIKKKPLAKKKTKSEPKSKELSEELVECVVCGTYSSVSDSFLKAGQYYCSRECLEK